MRQSIDGDIGCILGRGGLLVLSDFSFSEPRGWLVWLLAGAVSTQGFR